MPSPDGTSRIVKATEFKLDPETFLDERTRQEIALAFAKIADVANTLLIAPQKTLDDIRRPWLTQLVHQALEHSVANFMAAAYAASLDVAPETIKANGFLLVEPNMVEELGTESAAALLNVNHQMRDTINPVTKDALRSLLDLQRRNARNKT